jgi:predicted permease
LCIETCALSLAGGGLGLLLALWTTRALPALFMTEQAELLDAGLDPRIVALTVGVACLTGAVFGAAPALHGTASPAVTALRADPGGVSAHHGSARLRARLVGGQIALSALLLLAAGLLVRSLTHALEGELGSSVKKVAVVSMEMPGRFLDPARGVVYRNTLLERLQKLGGLEAVGWASTLPLGKGNRRQVQIIGDTNDVADTVDLESNVVSPGYFRAMAVPCIEGRVFDEHDTALSAPVAVVDELLARRYFGRSATGRHMVDAHGTRVEIVGVVRSGRYRTLQQSPQPTVYYAASQDYLWRGHVVMRTAGEPTAMLPAIRRTIKEVGEEATILDASTLEKHLADSLGLDRLTTTLVGLCGLIALAMSAIGVYGIMTDAVRRRTREIGLRVALGAGRTQVVRLVLLDAVYLAVTGLFIGGAAAFAIAHVARSMVEGIRPLDVTTVAAATATLAIVVAVAAVLPLRQALRVNPNIALRSE